MLPAVNSVPNTEPFNVNNKKALIKLQPPAPNLGAGVAFCNLGNAT